MFKKAIMALTLLIVMLLAISCVCAADNITDSIICFGETTDDEISIDEINVYDGGNFVSDDNDALLSLNDNSQILGVKETHFDDFKQGTQFISSLTIPLRDSNNNLIYNEKVTYSFDNNTAPMEYLSHSSIRLPYEFKEDSYHFLTLKYDGSSNYAPCEKVIAFKYVSGCFGTVVDKIPMKFEFEVVNFNIYNDSMKVYLKDSFGNSFSNLYFDYIFDDNGTVFNQKSNANGNNIKLNFAPLTTHTITLNFKGNNLFKKCTASKRFHIDSSIKLGKSEFVEGGKNIIYNLYYKNGDLKQIKTIFAPFGKSIINITNEATGQTLVKEVTVIKHDLKTNPLYIDYVDIVEYKVRVSENDKYAANQMVYFQIGDETYNATSDENGFAILKIHLKAGDYTITTKYANIVKSESIHLRPAYVGNKYQKAYISTRNAYYNEDNKITYGWEGNLDGYFEIYNGNSLVDSQNLNTGGYQYDYMTYNEHGYEYSTNKLKVGSYTVKIITNDGTVVKIASFKIIKTPTELEMISKTTNANEKVTISNKILDGIMGGYAKTATGKVTLKINGKSYSAKVKNGKFSVSFKAPSNAKKYSCKLTFSGDSNYKSSSTKFTVTVKKATIKKTTTKKTTSFTVILPVKLNQYTSKTIGKYKFRVYKHIEYNSNGRDYGITATLFKNNKALTLNKYESTYWWHFKSGKWKYMEKRRTISYNEFSNVDKIKVKITIK